MTTERTVILNSRFRAYRQDTSTNFNILLNRGIQVDDIDRIIVKRVSIPNFFYNVPERKNKIFLIHEGVPVTLTMSSGQYDGDQFRAAVEDLLQNGVDPSSTVTLDYSTGKYTLAYSTTFVLGWTLLSHAEVKNNSVWMNLLTTCLVPRGTRS